MVRSVRASQKGLEKATAAFDISGKTKEYIAGASKCSRPTLDKFFNRISIDKKIFIAICETLELDWREIGELDTSEQSQLENQAINELVEEIRAAVRKSVEEECGTMQVLDMTRPIELNDIYTQVNILEKIIGRRGFNVEQLLANCNLEDFDRFGLGRIEQQRISGLSAVNQYQKLMILGKPGAGKTTFLKYLAIQCNRGKFAEEKVPIFIPLKKYAETEGQPNIQSYIYWWFRDCGIDSAPAKIVKILGAGRGLILFDGLDEVREEDNQRVIRNIEDFYRLCSKTSSKNQFAITCRIAAREYTFTQFTEVEVADFDQDQIETFVTGWFEIKHQPDYIQHFMEQLQANLTIRELANNPLLLTLLCLEFEESGSFPSDRAELYARATNTLLRKWDHTRYIFRQQVYQDLTVKRKEGLLSQVAFQTFDNKEYFFKQRTIEGYIGEYISNLPNSPTEQTALDIDSQAVLKSIEAQHGLLVERARGIYSFSHLTFQEYFTARKIATISNPKLLETALTNLASHVTEKRWREVFLLTAAMLEPADRLLILMKQQIDQLIASDKDLQQLLIRVKDKSNSVEADYKIVAIRAFYLHIYATLKFSPDFDHFLCLHLSLDFNLSRSLSRFRSPSLNLSRSLDLDLFRDLSLNLYFNRSSDLFRDLSCSLSCTVARCKDQEFKPILEKLQQQLPARDQDREHWEQWWESYGAAWREELRQAMIKYRNIGHQWSFSQEQIDLLNQYLAANQLLVDCLNSQCYVSREVRAEIENTLLLPFEH
ncbi:MAG: NACHT domain-containing NTPase [Cyanobacteria bacterium J06621_8]